MQIWEGFQASTEQHIKAIFTWQSAPTLPRHATIISLYDPNVTFPSRAHISLDLSGIHNYFSACSICSNGATVHVVGMFSICICVCIFICIRLHLYIWWNWAPVHVAEFLVVVFEFVFIFSFVFVCIWQERSPCSCGGNFQCGGRHLDPPPPLWTHLPPTRPKFPQNCSLSNWRDSSNPLWPWSMTAPLSIQRRLKTVNAIKPVPTFGEPDPIILTSNPTNSLTVQLSLSRVDQQTCSLSSKPD